MLCVPAFASRRVDPLRPCNWSKLLEEVSRHRRIPTHCAGGTFCEVSTSCRSALGIGFAGWCLEVLGVAVPFGFFLEGVASFQTRVCTC